ncbi:hypothetical protein [Burkholderia sp. 9120]|uniref:WapI family immunity protein n=1 Tax=Burkholderia sp. 9120 TaxID=1500897 RepID=UPI00054E67E6|nr:hypothetical protein [Burkholderia sp. 9120]
MSEQPHVILAEPSLQIGRLKLWVHGRQFPLAQDYWDGNWLQVTALCGSASSTVSTVGPIVHLGELVQLLEECERLYESLSGIAKLDCMEPNLGVTLTAKTSGHVDVRIHITPNHMLEKHEFTESFDQTFLPAIIAQCREILIEHPLRKPESGH